VKKYFSQLRPLERRLAVGVLVVLFIVLNWVFVWPHFSDWNNLRGRRDDARNKLKLYQTAIAQMPGIQAQVKNFENEGEFVAPEDQSINFLRTIQSQALQSGVGIVNTSRQMTHTNEFFSEQTQNIEVIATEAQLVDFLYKLGSGASMVRVRDLELQPDAAHQHLSGKIRLVASYQKNATAPAPAATPSVKIPVMATHIATPTNSTQIKKIVK
jgi:Tfp pilus assembly protein PilO